MDLRTAGALSGTVMIFVTLLFATGAAGADFVFGPNEYTPASGKPQTFETTFTVDLDDTCDGRADYVLAVESDGIASGRIALNGNVVIGNSDFASNRTPIERAIAPAASNRIAITIDGGQRGATMRVAVRREIDDAVAPPMTFTLAANHGTFRATIPLADTSGKFILLARNGAGGASRVKSGSVSINGIDAITPKDLDATTAIARRVANVAAQNEVRVDLDGRAGDAVEISLRRVVDVSYCSAARILIESPTAGLVSAPRLIVTGTLSGSGRDAGVSVNGVPAELDLEHDGTVADPFRWVVIQNAEVGPITLAATVKTFSGATAIARRDIAFAPTDAPQFRAIPAFVIAPASIRFELTPAPANVTAVAADFDGDGSFEFSGTSLASLTHAYDTAGMRHVAVRVTSTAGTITADTWVNASSFNAIDLLLRERWSALRAALAARNLGAVPGLFSGEAAKEKYGIALARLIDRLPAIAASMDPILPVSIDADYAKYLLARVENGSEHGYYVYFIRDADGVWRVAQF